MDRRVAVGAIPLDQDRQPCGLESHGDYGENTPGDFLVAVVVMVVAVVDMASRGTD